MSALFADEPPAPVEALMRRFRARLGAGLSLARAYRFVLELEPFRSSGPDPFVEAAAAFKDWRLALRRNDVEAALDTVERTWPLLEACRQRVIARDAVIEAYRVRWACENATLRPQTLDSLARFYRLVPLSTSSQSKYEYVLTRRLAGPIGPERRLAPTEELRDAVVALELSWAANPVRIEDGEVAMVTLALGSFATEAGRHADAASFTRSAVLRRFGAFKASIGGQLFDPRVSVAVVETNVAVLNRLNQLLADAGGQPLRGSAPTRAAGALSSVKSPAGDAALPPLPDLDAEAKPKAAAAAEAKAEPPAATAVPQAKGDDAAVVKRRDRPQLLTGEIDLSGLEFLRPTRKKDAAAPATEPAVSEKVAVTTRAIDVPDATPEAAGTPRHNAPPPAEEGEPKPSDAVEEASPTTADATEGDTGEPDEGLLAEVEQQPSARAFELGKQAENAAIVERYLTEPRSPEVWQLDLDVFLGQAENREGGNHSVDKRRALELILTADDLICARAVQDDAPPAEHRASVRSVANAMLLLRTTLRRAADLEQGHAGEREPLLYVADHLLWERLRLEASLKRRPSRKRPLVLPRTGQLKAPQGAVPRRRRSRASIIRGAAAAVAVVAILGFGSLRIIPTTVDPEVRMIQFTGMPGGDLFDDARTYRSTLFVSASRSFVLLSKDERKTIVQGLGSFAAEQGLDTVSVVGPRGEPWATYKDGEVLLDGDLTVAEMAAR